MDLRGLRELHRLLDRPGALEERQIDGHELGAEGGARPAPPRPPRRQARPRLHEARDDPDAQVTDALAQELGVRRDGLVETGRVAGIVPATTARRSAQSSAVRAIGPTVSKLGATGRTPRLETRPVEGRSPVTPQ